MQSRSVVFCATGALVCVLTACGGSTPPANSPDSIEQSAMGESAEPANPTTGRGVEVGMEFEDKGDDSAEKRDRTPPPTQSYKPSSKGKQAAATQ
jgi:hypothetical protein